MKKIIIIVALVILLSGCTNLSQKQSTETKIKKTTGIGVLEFRPVVNKMLTNTYNYILLTIRNNAEGSRAKNIIASLENVNPFIIYECNDEHDPSEKRKSVCNQFFDDMGIPYKSHRLNDMLPDEDVQFFWNIKSPNDKEIGNMKYTHTIYYTLKYNYTSTVTQTIACISQDEYLKESKKSQVILSGQTIRSPGEIKIESKTQQPIIYVSGSTTPTEFNIEFEIINSGGGVPEPGSNILIAFKKDDLTEIGEQAASLNWHTYDTSQDLTKSFDEIFNSIQYPELGAENSNIRKGLILTTISASQMSNGNYHIVIPIKLNTENLYEPQKILTFTAYIAYTYLKEGSTIINVYPTQ